MPPREATAAKQQAFLDAYRELVVVSDALAVAGISRKDMLNWKRGSEEFRVKLEEVEAEITDKVAKLAFKHAGVLKWTAQELDEQVNKLSDRRMVEVLVRRDPRYRESGVQLNQNIMAITINGVSSDDIKKIVTPDDPRAQAIDAEVVVRNRLEDLAPGEGDVPLVGAAASGPNSAPAYLTDVIKNKLAQREAKREAQGIEVRG